ncbi:MAG: DNA polymerase III subunit alpha, partial [Flavobacteriales bacterium]|nr:DNA polymerase III subunit alpha [Flavobacteriales bacterium]
TLDKMKGKFLEGTASRGFDAKVCEKIWTNWEAFAQYAFNKSHSTCYAFVAYQTAWLKANHPAEYMASVLTHNQTSIDKVTFFMEECRRMGIPVLGPDVNESFFRFSVVKDKEAPEAPGSIRFGLGAVKGVGEGAVEAIIQERREHGPFTSIHDLFRRVDLRAANRKAMESLAYAGAFDTLGVKRSQFFHSAGEGRPTFLEVLVRYGQLHQDGAGSAQVNMFEMSGDEAASLPEPPMPEVDEWIALEKLHHEKEVVGFYLSGHPLDDHLVEIRHLVNTRLSQLGDLASLADRELSLAGIVTRAEHRTSKSGKPFGSFGMEDHHGSHDFMLFGEDYLKFRHFLAPGTLLYMKARAAERTWGRDQGKLELTISRLDLLGEVREKYIQRLLITVEADRVSDALTEQLRELLSKHPGRTKVSVTLFSASENIRLEAQSKGIEVTVDRDLLGSLDRIPELEYGIS